ncbi:hypothetical protein HV824_20655 [Myxococcus sp. AM009]|uniref:RHS repeat-associated core domain-containing protein n=1 Tax=Myxococcus sp. AM009 TaxID=2745137 RepID=UPI0015962E38|nr:hypothetical protein [Myxococcus sp. AM009]
MNRFLSVMLGAVVAVSACGPSDESEKGQMAGGRHRAQGLEVLVDALLPTETDNEGFVAARSTGFSGVAADGASTYSLPIWLPSGRAGIQPELSLGYKSDGGNGIIGRGWSLAGASQVSRCGLTQAQDGKVEAITFTADDAFCLDGQRLVSVNGVYGASYTEYRTERETFSKIVSMGADALGPREFHVFLKSGHKLTYGFLHHSTLAGRRTRVRPSGLNGFLQTVDTDESRLSWALARLEDRSGNSVSFHYALHSDLEDGSVEQTLERIEYTASSLGQGVPATRFVVFEYESRSDSRVSYAAGFKLKLSKRLKEIKISAPNPISVGLVRAYRLGYMQDAISGASMLKTFQECDGNGACVRPIVFWWSSSNRNFTEQDTGLADVVPSSFVQSGHSVLNTVDVDGDGRDDLLYRAPSSVALNSKWILRSISAAGQISGGDVFSLPLHCGVATAGHDGRWADVNMDGRMDVSLLVQNTCGPGPTSNIKHLLQSNNPSPGANWFYEIEDDGRQPGTFWYGDLNGDGLSDLIRVEPTAGQLGFRLNMAGSLQPFQAIHASDRNDNSQFAVNLDGSGKTSLFILEKRLIVDPVPTYQTVGRRYWSLTWRDGVFEKKETTLVRTDVSTKQYIFVDINGDGLPDALREQKAEPSGDPENPGNEPEPEPVQGDVEVLINTGDGFAAPYTITLPQGAKLGAFTRDNGIRVFDFNGDGRQDLLLMDDGDGSRSRVVVLESNGTSFVPRSLDIPVGQATTRGYSVSQILDVNGDGLMDLAQVVNGTLRIYRRRGPPSGLLTKVTDSLGSNVDFIYKPMADASVYTPGTSCSYPQQCVRSGRWLVAEHLVDSGKSSPRRRAYTYEDGRVDVLGRGWLGFAAMSVSEIAAGARVRTEFDNRTRVGTHYPYANIPKKTVTEVALTGRIHKTVESFELAHHVRQGGRGGSVITVLPATAQEQVYDRLESEGPTDGLLRQVDTEWGYDWNYGNPTSVEKVIGSEVMVESIQYQNDPQNWLVGLPVADQKTHTVNGVSVTRNHARTYWPGTALLASETIEPGSAHFEVVTTYLRDPDGLAYQISRSATGAQWGIPIRTMGISYDPVDRTYPTVMTNSLGHTVRVAYHSGLGLVSVSEDENGLITKRRFDGFGRLRAVDAPDSSDSTISYRACVAPGESCSLAVSILRRMSPLNENVPGFVLVDEESSTDRLGRWMGTRKRGFSEENVNSGNLYDELGRVTTQWLPPPGGSGSGATSFAYDNLGRTVRTTYPDGTSETKQYEGRKVTTWDEKGNSTIIWLDEHGRPQTTEDMLGTRRIVSSTRFGPFGQLESVTNGYGQGPRYQYDRLGRQSQVNDPDSGLTVTDYNPFGEVTRVTDANGDATVFERDTLGRMTVRTNRDGVARFTWDHPVDNPSVGWVGALFRSAVEGDASTSLDDIVTVHSYDALGRPVGEDWSVEGQVYSVSRTFDEYGLLRRLDYPSVGTNRFSVDYNYTARGVLESVGRSFGGTLYWKAQARNGLGQLTAEEFGNGVTSQRRYDTRGRTVFIETKGPAAPQVAEEQRLRQMLAYEYDVNGNMRSRHDRLSRTTEDFFYDSLNRLVKWSVYQNCTPSSVEYGYDDLGNLLGRSVTQGAGENLSLFYEGTGGAGPHAVTRSSLGSYTYDANGNQLTGPSRVVEYTTFNLPSHVSQGSKSLSYRYDAMNTRTVKRDSNGDVTVYVGGIYERRRVATGAAVHVFSVIGSDGPVAQVSWAADSTGQVSVERALYLHVDRLGTVETITDEFGAVFERSRFEPYGGRRYPNALGVPQVRGNSQVRQGFTGHEHDDEVGLINMKGRVYDPVLGRFLSPDPLMVGPRMSQALNRYSYGLGNPLRYTDPTGFAVNELPVIVYDSWFGGYSVAGVSGNAAINEQQMLVSMLGPDLADPTTYLVRTEYVSENGRPVETRDYYVVKIPEHSSMYYYRRFVRAWVAFDVIKDKLEFGKGLFLGAIAGAVPFLGLVPPPEGSSKDFHLGYGAALFAWGGVQIIGSGVAIAGGGTASTAGAAASSTGVGAPVGAPAAVIGGSVAVSGAAVAALGVANIIGALNAVQMANQSGGGGGAPSTSDTKSSTAKAPEGGSGGSVENISAADATRIQNAANRIGSPIHLVGSRASGKSGPNSDWDFVIEPSHSNHHARSSAAASLPGAKSVRDGVWRNQDVFKGPLDRSRPYVTFFPE